MQREIGPLTYKDSGWSTDDYEWWLCGRELATWFDVDRGRPLWVRIYKRPGKNRLRVTKEPGGFWAYVRCELRSGRTVRVEVSREWVTDLGVSYPYYVEMVQEED